MYRLSQEIIARKVLLDFPYYSNYVDLARMELDTLASVSSQTGLRTFAVLGSGPLPLTSLRICEHFNTSPRSPGLVTVHNVDQSLEAVSCSLKMCRALGYPAKTVSFQRADAGRVDVDLRAFDVVYLAALVGECCKQKQSILSSVVKRMRAGSFLLLRSAHSLRKLLYPVLRSNPFSFRK